MARTPIWKEIASSLTNEVGSGQYAPGDKLPTEAALATRFGVNRHTVRQAIAALVAAGLLYSRRGAGVYVVQTPTDYPLGKRVRFHQNLIDAKRVPAKDVLSLTVRPATLSESSALALDSAASIVAYEGLSLADNQPIALFRSIFPAAPFPDLQQDLEETRSVTAALMRAGIDDYTRISTRLTAKTATAMQAHHLRIKEGDPILRSVSVNADPSGRPVEFGHTWFAGDKVTLTLSGE